MVSLTYLGHSAFEAKFGNKTILLDPWLDPRPKSERLTPPAYTADQVKNADLVLITHEHPDHFDPLDIKRIYERTFAHIVAPEHVFDEISIPESRKVVAYVGDEFNYLGFDIKVMESKHPQSKYAVGYIVSDGKESIYHSGDTYDFFGLSKVSADIAMLPIGGTYTMDIYGALSALKKMRVSHVIPMHYNTFANIRADPVDFARKAVKESKAQVHVLGIGQTFQT